MRSALACLVIAACSGRAAPATVISIDARPADAPISPISIDAAAPAFVRGPLPAALSPRVSALLAEPVPDDVIVRFAEISRTDDDSADTRWDLHRDGRLYYATAGRPFPSKASLHVDAKHIREIFAALAAQGFYAHPGYEAVPAAIGGTTVIVRARTRDDKDRALTTVVFDASRPDLLDFLETVTVSL